MGPFCLMKYNVIPRWFSEAFKKTIKKPQVRVGITWGYLTLQRISLIPGDSPERDPPHKLWGPPVIGVAMFLKIDFQVEVILILTTDKRKIVSRKSFKNTQLLLYW